MLKVVKNGAKRVGKAALVTVVEAGLITVSVPVVAVKNALHTASFTVGIIGASCRDVKRALTD